MADTIQIREISDDDREWIGVSLALAQRISAHYGMAEDNAVEPHQLDVLFQKWKADTSPGKPTDQEVATGLGCALGQYLTDRVYGRWIVATDSFGTMIAVQSTSTGWLLFPIDAVWKRIDPHNGESSFFEPIASAFTEH